MFQVSDHGLSDDKLHLRATQEPNLNHLIQTKDASITQEIPRDLGAPYQEPGTKTKHEMLLVYNLGNYKG